MKIYLKKLEGERFTLEVDSDYSISRIRNMIYEKTGIHPYRFRLIFAGRLLDGKRKFSDYNMSQHITLHIVENFEVLAIPFEIQNFEYLRKTYLSHHHDRRIVSEKNVSSAANSCSFENDIINSGSDGPLIIILSFFDAMEVLFGFRSVCKAITNTIEFLIENDKIKFTEDHLLLMFGNKYFHASESMFLKLVSSYDHVITENTKIREDMPYTKNNSKILISMIQVCSERKWLMGLRYIIEERKFSVNDEDSKCLEIISEPLDRTEGDEIKVRDLMQFMIDNVNILQRFHLKYTVFTFLFSMGETERILKLLRNPRNIYFGRSKGHLLLDSYRSTLKNNCVNNEEQAGLVFWKEFSSFFNDELNLDPGLHKIINDSFPFMKWKLVYYILTTSSSSSDKLFSPQYELTSEMLENHEENLINFILKYHASDNNHTLNVKNIYYPRFQLMDACLRGDLNDVKKFLLLFDPEMDLKIHKKKYFNFPFSKIIKDHHPEIVRCLLMNDIKVMYKQYESALEEGNLDLCVIFEEYTGNIKCRYSYYDENPIEKMCILNMKKKRSEISLSLLFEDESLMWDISNTDDTHKPMPRILKCSIRHGEKDIWEVLINRLSVLPFIPKIVYYCIGEIFINEIREVSDIIYGAYQWNENSKYSSKKSSGDFFGMRRRLPIEMKKNIISNDITYSEIVKNAINVLLEVIRMDTDISRFGGYIVLKCLQFKLPFEIPRAVFEKEGWANGAILEVLKKKKWELVEYLIKRVGVMKYIVECEKCAKEINLVDKTTFCDDFTRMMK